MAKKNGYVYVYTSNESQQDVLFDNMSVTQATGPVLEETHYYPYGLAMAGISTVAPLRIANAYRYNGKELNHEEFSDNTGLELYDYGFREYDPQIARFPQLDPLTDEFAVLTPYQYASNDPIANIDLDGLEGVPVGAAPLTASEVANVNHWLSTVTVVASRPVTTSGKVINGLSVAGKVENISTVALQGARVAGNVLNSATTTQQAGNMAMRNIARPAASNAVFSNYETPDDKAFNALVDFYKDVDFEHGQLLPARNSSWDFFFGHRRAFNGQYVGAAGYPLSIAEQAIQRQADADIALFSAIDGPGELFEGLNLIKDAGKAGENFTKSNFRSNLIKVTELDPGKAFQAHHVFPQKFANQFAEHNINIHNPKFGAWWETTSHLKNAKSYNAAWENFLLKNPAEPEIMEFGRQLMGQYGISVGF